MVRTLKCCPMRDMPLVRETSGCHGGEYEDGIWRRVVSQLDKVLDVRPP
jgi:hypothetical protein